jgi:hypothetical protein
MEPRQPLAALLGPEGSDVRKQQAPEPRFPSVVIDRRVDIGLTGPVIAAKENTVRKEATTRHIPPRAAAARCRWPSDHQLGSTLRKVTE